jgi:hypothetical protein
LKFCLAKTQHIIDAGDIQNAIYRQMTPAQRWAQAVRLWRQARALTEAGVRLRNPDASEAEVQQRVARLFLHGNESIRR